MTGSAVCKHVPKALRVSSHALRRGYSSAQAPLEHSWSCCRRLLCIACKTPSKQSQRTRQQSQLDRRTIPAVILQRFPKNSRVSLTEQDHLRIEVRLSQGACDPYRDHPGRKIIGTPAFPSNQKCDSYGAFKKFSNRTPRSIRKTSRLVFAWRGSRATGDNLYKAVERVYVKSAGRVPEVSFHYTTANSEHILEVCDYAVDLSDQSSTDLATRILMTSDSPKPTSEVTPNSSPAQHRPLVVGLTKPIPQSNIMASAEEAAALNKEIQKNVQSNVKSAAPAEESTAESSQPKQKKEKAPKQPKPPKAAPAAAPTSPALIDLRVGHILRAIAHPNADSLYVSTIAMGDPEGTEHTQVDEETGKVVRTVCSGLNGLVPLAEMQDRKIIVVANLKPVNMRSIKSAAMVLAASPKQAEGADAHAPDRVVELVMPPESSEAGDKVYFEGWPYGEGKGPEKQLNPKKKQWEAIQPGFYTDNELFVGFDASNCEEVSGSEKGRLVVEGKGPCRVKTLKGAVVR